MPTTIEAPNRILLLSPTRPKGLVYSHFGILTSSRQVTSAVDDAPLRTLWIAASGVLLGALLAKMVGHIAGRHWLLDLEREPRHDFNTLRGLFGNFVPRPSVILPTKELIEALRAPNRAELCIGGTVDHDAKIVTLIRGDLGAPLIVALSDFEPTPGGPIPDFTQFSVTDCGQTLRFGDYEAAFEAVLYEHDPEYRRRIKAKRLAADRSFGASLRRLRKQRRLLRTDFPGIAAKTIARIERGEVDRPHPGTLAKLARVLRVPKDEIGEF